MRRWAAAAACLAGLVVSGAPAGAQLGDTSARLYVSTINGIVGPGTVSGGEVAPDADLRGRLLIENDGDVALEDLRLAVEVFDRARFRSTARIALDGAPTGLRDSIILDIDDPLDPGDLLGFPVVRPAEVTPWARASESGVYPVRVTLLHGTEELDTFTTAIVYLAAPVTTPLRTTLVWPLDEPPWRQPGEVYRVDADASIRPGGRLERLLRVAEGATGAGILLAPAAHLLEDLEDRADGFDRVDPDGTTVAVGPEDPAAIRAAEFLQRLRDLAQQLANDPVASAYADADIAALTMAPAPLDDEAGAAASRGRRQVGELLGRAPSTTSYWVTTPLNRDALDVLADRGVEHLLLPWSGTQFEGDLATNPDLPPSLRVATTTRGRVLHVTVTDPYIDQIIDGATSPHGPTLVGQRLLAETAVLWTERPGAEGRPLGLQPPPDWDASGPVLEELLTALREAPWIALSTPAEQRSGTAEVAPPTTLAGDVTALPAGLIAELLAARTELSTFIASTPDEVDVAIAGRDLASLERQLERSPSFWWRRAGAGEELARDVRDTIAAGYGTVDVPTGARITLTSEVGTIPVTIQRTTGDPLQVRVALESSARLQWPEGQEELVTFNAPGVRTLSFPVRVAAAGSFGVNVTVTDISGTRVLASGTIPVRSTAISRPALIGVGSVVLILLGIGMQRRRRPTRPRLEVVGDGDT